MSDIHAVARTTTPSPGRCAWIWDWEDVRLECTDPAIPGGQLCADHLIARAHATPDPDIAAAAEVVAFGPVLITAPDFKGRASGVGIRCTGTGSQS